jgi:putative peptidoglycan lipid II flippase
MAISLAVLPRLSQIDASTHLERFKSTFSLGLRLVLVVIIPAAVGLFVLGVPIIELLFEHGEWTGVDTAQTWRALRLYLIGLPFAAIDLPLVFAFYAQKDTVTPVVIGILGVLLYLAVGPVLAFVAELGFLGLVIANSTQLAGHALLMLLCFRRRFQGLRGYGVLRAAAKATGASLLMAGLCYGGYLLMRLVPLPAGMLGEAILVGVCGGLGVLGYLAGARLLRIAEVEQLVGLVLRRLGLARRAQAEDG